MKIYGGLKILSISGIYEREVLGKIYNVTRKCVPFLKAFLRRAPFLSDAISEIPFRDNYRECSFNQAYNTSNDARICIPVSI